MNAFSPRRLGYENVFRDAAAPATPQRPVAPEVPVRKDKSRNETERHPVTNTSDDRFKAMTLIALNPNHNAAAVVRAFSQDTFGESNPLVAAAELERLCDDVNDGDTDRIEAMLLSQAVSLEVIFAALARRGSQQENIRHFESFMRLALRAQSQARTTLEALATIKNPPMVFAKQANIAHGHQQVNNGIEAPPSRAEQIESRPNELLEHDHGERMDPRATGAASRSY